MLDTYVHDANGIIYVYDVMNEESFKAVEYWEREVMMVRAEKKNKGEEKEKEKGEGVI